MYQILATLKTDGGLTAVLPPEAGDKLASDLFHVTNDVVDLSKGHRSVPLRCNVARIQELAEWAKLAADVVDHDAVTCSEGTENLDNAILAAIELSSSLDRIYRSLLSQRKKASPAPVV